MRHREPPLLAVEDLTTTFRTDAGPALAVDHVSLIVERGTTLAIVGESGSGKTVLSRSIMGLLPGRGVERTGSVRYEGRELVGASGSELRAIWGVELAMVFQDPMSSLNPVVKIGRQITESMTHHLGVSRAEARERAIVLLDSVRIPEAKRRMGEYPHQLSGGMRQRVAIAIALACGPHLLIADEPTTALDVTVQSQILDVLAQQQRERFMAMILVTHDLGVVAGRADEIIVMYAGQIVERAKTRSLFGNVKMPYTEALLQSIPRIDDPPHRRLQAIAGRPPSPIDLPSGCRFASRCPYVRERCRAEAPPLLEAAEPGHLYRCWYPVEAPAATWAAAR